MGRLYLEKERKKKTNMITKCSVYFMFLTKKNNEWKMRKGNYKGNCNNDDNDDGDGGGTNSGDGYDHRDNTCRQSLAPSLKIQKHCHLAHKPLSSGHQYLSPDSQPTAKQLLQNLFQLP